MMRKPRAAFTLVELLVVIGIIGLLITLLMPTVTMALLTARKGMTQRIIKDLGMGVQAFHADFGFYPPSKPYDASPTAPKTGDQMGPMPTGAANLVYYVMGPMGKGWGVAGGGGMPQDLLSNPTGARPTRSYGPYYQCASEDLAYETPTAGPFKGKKIAGGFLDAFKPPGKILYCRYDPSATDSATEPVGFVWKDNNYNSAASSLEKNTTNYADPAKMCEIVRKALTTTAPRRFRFARQDYILISPGADGRYGYCRTNDAGEIVPASVEEQNITYDDITNWQ
jgi:prepilin-type N-terminal cleavage/methylation domain-containing protein